MAEIIPISEHPSITQSVSIHVNAAQIVNNTIIFVALETTVIEAIHFAADLEGATNNSNMEIFKGLSTDADLDAVVTADRSVTTAVEVGDEGGAAVKINPTALTISTTNNRLAAGQYLVLDFDPDPGVAGGFCFTMKFRNYDL